MDYSKVSMVEYQEKKKAILGNFSSSEGYYCDLKPCGECHFCKGDCCLDCALDRTYELKNPIETVKLVMEYEIPFDWSKVKKDTPLMVKYTLDGQELPVYFAMYKKGRVWAFSKGRTSFTAQGITAWDYARLAESEELI